MWVLPTYKRPDRCQATLDSIAASGPTRGVVVVDGDYDPRYSALRLPEGWQKVLCADNQGVCSGLNYILHKFPDEPWYGFISDDSIVRTQAFEAPLIAAAGRTGFASSADGWQAHRRMHGAIVFGGDLLRALGWWAPPGLFHCFCDDVWEFLASALGNWRKVPEVMVEHRHHMNNKAEKDEAYGHAYSRDQADAIAFRNLRRTELPAAVDRAIPVVIGADAVKRRLARARSRNVMICVPTARAPAFEFTISYADTCIHLVETGVRSRQQFVIGSSNLPRARNELVARFLASDCSDLIFIDDDMGWKPESIVRLLASDKQVIAGVGRKRVDKPNSDPEVWCVHVDKSAEHGIVQDDFGAVEVLAVGTAFMKIERSVFENLIALHPEWKRDGHDGMSDAVKANYYQFFRFDPDDTMELGEDFVFCRRVREAGGSIWIDPAIWLAHVGSKSYSGCISELMVEAPMREAAE